MDGKPSENLTAPTTSFKSGDIVAGRFEITSVIGSGGFGVVYKGRQLNLDRDIALKVMHSWIVSDSESIARFEREGKILTSLQHKNIVAVHSFGIDDNQRCYMSMQYLKGRTLAELVRHEGKMQWQRAVRIVIQVCDALAVAHEHGVVHRDLKPQNVMLVEGPDADFVKLLDFGLCGALADTMTDFQKLTQTGEVLGSVHYMAPEVCQGLRADRRSDVYSVGCILYECLSGRPPLDADDAVAVMFLQAGTMPARLKEAGINRELPDQLELAVFKSMQKDPGERFQTMEEFCEALRAIVRGKVAAIDARDLVLGSSTKVTKKKAARFMLISVCAIVATLLVAVPLFWSRTAGESNAQHYLAAFQEADAEMQSAITRPYPPRKQQTATFSHSARLLEQALSEAPADWPRRDEAQAQLASCYVHTDMPAELHRLLATWHPSSHSWDQTLSDSYEFLGGKALTEREYDKAEHYGQVLLTEVRPKIPRDLNCTRMRGLSLIGQSYLDRGRIPEAIDYLERALQVDDKSPNDVLAAAKVDLARIYLGEYGKAVPGKRTRACALLQQILAQPAGETQDAIWNEAAMAWHKYYAK